MPKLVTSTPGLVEQGPAFGKTFTVEIKDPKTGRMAVTDIMPSLKDLIYTASDKKTTFKSKLYHQ